MVAKFLDHNDSSLSNDDSDDNENGQKVVGL